MVWLFSAAIVAGVYRFPPLLAGVVAIALLRALLLRAPHAWVAASLVAACGGVGWAAIQRADAARRAVARVAARGPENTLRLRGWIASFPESGRYGSTFVFATVVDGRPVRIRVRAPVFEVHYGEALEIDARLATASRTPAAFLTSRGVAGEARARRRDVRRLEPGHGCPLLREVLWPMHAAARVRLARALGADAALPVGLLLGERATLDAPARDAVVRLGIAHLLALSGMHLTMIAALAVLAARWAPRGRDAVVALALSLYVGVVGDVDSLTRAYGMAVLILAARALVRPARPVDALGKALFVMLLCRPCAALSVGLQLSCAATLAVLLFVERAPAVLVRASPPGRPLWRRALRRCAQGAALAFLISLAVEVLIAPLQLHHFGRVSLVGPLATVAFLLPVSVLQGMALVAAFDLPAVGGPLVQALGWTADAVRGAILATGAAAPAQVALPAPHWTVYYAAVFVLCAQSRRPAAWLVAAAGLVASFCIG